MKRHTMVIALTLIGLLNSHIASGSPIPDVRLASEAAKWLKSYGKSKSEFTDCRSVFEISRTLVCLFKTQEEMNQVLGRVTAFSEGSLGIGTKYALPSKGDPYTDGILSGFRGHNVSRESAIRFLSAAPTCMQETTKCIEIKEGKFLTEGFLANEQVDYLIAVGGDEADARDILAHEILHAQYFASKEYQAVVKEFWEREMREAEKSEIKSFLAQAYDSTDEALMQNEFQAYILMSGAEKDFLGPAVATYRSKLLRLLMKKGISPLQVK